MTTSRTIGVALLGLGNVGGGVVKLLADNAAAIEARLGARLEVRAIGIRDRRKTHRVVEVDTSLLVTDLDAAIKRDDIEIVCELMGGVTDARHAVMTAIAAGKQVVTANKALLAIHGTEIFAAAEAAGVDVYYEAAVCGGVPIIRVIREGLASDRVEAFWGIVNGTSNYILSTMTETRRPFADILKDAQALGYAEADPTLDVSGGDAAHKLAVLVRLCFGTALDVDQIPTDGIDHIQPIDLDYAAKFGFVLKPLVIARAHADGQIEARVHPALVPANWLLADVSGAKNAVYVQSYALGPSLYYGAGAGMLPTAMSVVSDCIDIGRNIFARAAGAKRPTGGLNPAGAEPRPMLPLADVRSKYYLRFGVIDAPGVLGRLMTILGAHEVSIAQVVQDAEAQPVSVVVVTHESREGDVRAALTEIDALPVVREPARVIRIVG